MGVTYRGKGENKKQKKIHIDLMSESPKFNHNHFMQCEKKAESDAPESLKLNTMESQKQFNNSLDSPNHSRESPSPLQEAQMIQPKKSSLIKILKE